MNVECQFCGLVICILLWVLFSTKKQLNLYGAQLFKNMLLFATFLLSMDIASIVCIKYQESLPSLLVIGVCKTYIVLLVFEVCTALLYLLYDVLGEGKHRRYARMIMALKTVESLVIFFAPLYIHSEGRIAYTEGPGALLAYLFCGIDFIVIVAVAIFQRKKILPRRLTVFMIWVCIWFASAVFQFLDAELLLVGFAASLGVLILYATLENQDGNFVRELGCFNGYALELYLGQLFERQKKFYMVLFSVDQDKANLKILIEQILRRPVLQKEIYLFKLIGPEFLLITEKEKLYEAVVKWIQISFKKDSEYSKRTQIICCANALDVGFPQKVVPFAHYLFERFKKRGATLDYEVSADVLDSFLMQDKMQDEILLALKEDRVEVFLQPIYGVRSESFVSAEALVRIRTPKGHLVSPGLFIPVAEKTGSIVPLGERIFEKTCEFIATGKMQELGIGYVEINLSVFQCEQENLAESLSKVMDKYKVDPRCINLEITETATLKTKEIFLSNMEKLIDKGCCFSLDDFGKGESNLMYIVDMPVSIVKMDYDLTKAFFKSDKAKNVVYSVVRMAHDMGLSVVSEGIETKEELDALVEAGVDYIQGFYFSKPLPVNEFLEFLRMRG
ncbi:MAG: EAL domain-containing protein [Fibrobacter sp.]|nr:EAL domain-containing protein [Fibrobacter sp.]